MDEPAGAGVMVERTNSGEGILLICSRKVFFHGAGPEGARWVVVDMVRARQARRWRGFEAMFAAVARLFESYICGGCEIVCLGN